MKIGDLATREIVSVHPSVSLRSERLYVTESHGRGIRLTSAGKINAGLRADNPWPA